MTWFKVSFPLIGAARTRVARIRAGLSVRLARAARRGAAVRPRADLREPRARLRACLDALGNAQPLLCPGRCGRAGGGLVGRALLGRAERPARARRGAADRAGAGDREVDRAAAVLRVGADAARAALPGGRRRAYRAADGGQGAERGVARRGLSLRCANRLVHVDSDFTRLAARIREQGLDMFGFGEAKHPRASGRPASASC